MTAKKNGTSPDKRRKYDETFKAEALRLALESRSTQAAARQLGSRPKLLYRWQQGQPAPEPAWQVALRNTIPEDLVSEALRRALAVRRPPAGLVIHSDQGSQYMAARFKDLAV